MFYICFAPSASIPFLSAGRFVSHHPHPHPKRRLESAVLLLGYSGKCAIAQDDREYTLERGTFMLLFPDTLHYGTRPTTNDQSHFWCHFLLPEGFVIREADSAEELNRDGLLVLPEFSRIRSSEKLFVLFSQMIDEAEARRREAAVICEHYIKILLLSLADQCRESTMQPAAGSSVTEKVKEWVRLHACEGIRVFAEYNQPITLVSAPMNGITSPIYLLSTVILDVVETLAGLVYAQLVRPGVPMITSATCTSGNMRYATWECASPDSALMLGAVVQMYKKFYNLPTRSQTGVTSSKTIDFQAGMEVMQSFLFTALAGVNLTSNSVGALSNLMTTSLEKCVLDDEMISRVRFIINGMKTDEEQMGMKELMNCKPCQDFLMEESTCLHVRDGWQPTVSDWRSSDAWEADGSKDVVETAHQKVLDILEAAPASMLDPEQEKDMLKFIASVK